MPGFTLYKLSYPGFVKNFETRRALVQALKKGICSMCLDGERDYIGDGEIIFETVSPPLHNTKNYNELLSTACGCEYHVEKCWGYHYKKLKGKLPCL